MDHLAENTIVGYAGGNLKGDERRRVEEHIDECAECRATLAVFVGGSTTPYAGATGRDQDPAASEMPKPGERLADRFTIVKLIGHGGMGYVYDATDDDLGIHVALKLLRPELTIDEEQVRHLRREILAGRRIAHPNVCRVFDLGKGERLHFITMELCSGETLADRLRAGATPLPKVIEILDQLLGALEAAHAEGIVHRDLKPANVMIDAAGKIKVMDFGLARDLKGEHSLKGLVGTPAYWAPEQARGEAAGPAADLYAVGLLGYLLASGETSTRKASERLDKVPAPLRPWIETCLQEEPTLRYASAREARAVLMTIRIGDSQRRWPLVAVAAAALAALAVIVFATVRLSRSDSDPVGASGTTSDAPLPRTGDASPQTVDSSVIDGGLITGQDASAIDARVIDATRLPPEPRDAGRRPSRPVDAAAAPSDASLLFEP